MTPHMLMLTPAVWRATIDALAPYRTARVEGGCLWYGHWDSTVAEALVVGVPKQHNWPQRFEVPAEALAELNLRMRDELVVVAQVHSHPGANTTHSPWDDTMIVSHRIFSLVLPFYTALPCDVRTAGVHVYDGAQWRKLGQTESARRVVVKIEAHPFTREVVIDTR